MQVPPAALAAAARPPAASAAAKALFSAFLQQERAQQLILEAPPGQVLVKLIAAREQAAAAGGVAGQYPSAPVALPLEAHALQARAMAGDAGHVQVTPLDGCTARGVPGAAQHFTGLLLEKTAAPGPL